MKNITVVLLILGIGALVKFNALAIVKYIPEYLSAIIFFAVFIYSFISIIKFILKKKSKSDKP